MGTVRGAGLRRPARSRAGANLRGRSTAGTSPASRPWSWQWRRSRRARMSRCIPGPRPSAPWIRPCERRERRGSSTRASATRRWCWAGRASWRWPRGCRIRCGHWRCTASAARRRATWGADERRRPGPVVHVAPQEPLPGRGDQEAREGGRCLRLQPGAPAARRAAHRIGRFLSLPLSRFSRLALPERGRLPCRGGLGGRMLAGNSREEETRNV